MKELTIRSIDPLALAKIEGIVMAVLGFFVGGLYAIVFGIIGAVEEEPAALGAAVAAACGGPIIYGIMGFIGGLIGAFVYNLAAGWVGGVILTVEERAA